MNINKNIWLILFTFSIVLLQAYNDLVTVNISTVGWRQKSLKMAIETIIDQVDHINVFLQHYETIPEFLNHSKITVVMGQDFPEALALGAAAKFFWADKTQGYHFTIDDDILYPANYVSYCIKKIEQYKRKAVVGFHGSIFRSTISNYWDRKIFSYTKMLKNDTTVHMLGTGVLAYHTDTIKISMKDFAQKNMDDLFFAIAAQKQKIPLICIQHNDGYLRSIAEFANDPQSICSNPSPHMATIAQAHQPWILYNLKKINTNNFLKKIFKNNLEYLLEDFRC